MIWTSISDELLEMLTPYSDWFFKQDLEWINKLSKDNPKNTDSLDNALSSQYLQAILDMDGHQAFGSHAIRQKD